MKDIKLFEKWIKDCINKDKKLIVNVTDEEIYLTNGYVMFKIPRWNKEFIKVIQHNTFQTLRTDFIIQDKELKEECVDIIPCYPTKANKKVITTNLKLNDCYESNIFLIEETKELYFLNTNYTKYLNIETAKSIKTESTVSLCLIEFKDYEAVICPIRVSHIPYKIFYDNKIYRCSED